MKITKKQLRNAVRKLINESTDRSYNMEYKEAPIPLQSLADPEFARLVKSSINERESYSEDQAAGLASVDKINITKNQLRAIINEELGIISERFISLSDFPDVGIPQYNTRSDREMGPEYGIDQLNGKVNRLRNLIIVLNDNLPTTTDVREIVDEEIKSLLGGNQEEDRASIANPQDVED
tara:strand:+ start:813 stop:1352 length:540 start_codon:yes stop_codon:yes gene_type:complete